MLNKNLMKLLNDLTPAVFATVDGDKPYLAFVSWLIAKDQNTLRVALSKNSKSVENVKNNPNVAISVFGPEIAATIYGKAEIIKNSIEDIPFGVSVLEVKVENVVDNLFPGATVKGTIPFEHTGNVQKALELDDKVLKALRS
ncbi:pyridoxamine 5'-phosphate oxidase-related FMN-binding [Sulfurihydrogenibium azorense Az-Fu1]|uniref:Pyridoxamine 5'-phosphate oxidase-related FMN-binding n=1 Tax=Sulfurihydrogenibium azorense (strain DSM 15241 / OCM 825 / Az-Fu1) TaxID=204536 RepID=C1DTD3_SULAA|nr:pyridoxamine 5'-phosphate oxidase family protein [Sulfurihydrogenibium azorense]ACN99178.1 pyridoxamine 5'-phosphate oxidase-related FMN-binding [Sulfurihydrogenibium azorense Az-Fu1]